MTYTVVLHYSGPTGRAYGPESYELDLEHLEGSAMNEDQLKKIADSIKEMEREMGRWTDGLSGIRIVDRTESTIASEREWRKRRDAELGSDGES